MKTQDADLTTKAGLVERAQVPAFPDNPGLIVVPEGILTWGLTSTHYFVPDDPVIGYGTSVLSYHEVDPYEIGASA